MPYWADRELSFEFNELTGALGDSVTVSPMVVGLGALTEASLAYVLFGFGAFQVLWGFVCGFPISVEPMKALAGLAVAAGLLVGVALLVGGRLGLLSALTDRVPPGVVRGVQLAVALVLARTGLSLAAGGPVVGAVAAAGGLAVTVLASRGVAALAALTGGVAAAVAGGSVSVGAPSVALSPAGEPALTGAVLGATRAQLAMTVGNAAVATSPGNTLSARGLPRPTSSSAGCASAPPRWRESSPRSPQPSSAYSWGSSRFNSGSPLGRRPRRG